MQRAGLAVALAALLTVASASSALARVLLVDDDGAQCPDARYASIQAAVNEAEEGDTVKVCPGYYLEQVTIGRSGVTLQSQRPMAAVIQAPWWGVDNPGHIVRVTGGAQDVVVRAFTISGPLPDKALCSSIARAGVRVDGGASARIQENWITDIRSAGPGYRFCANGYGILVGRHAEDQAGTATIVGNVIDLYQKGGVFIDGAGSFADVMDNYIGMAGATDSAVPNGIQVSHGASATVRRNRVTGNTYDYTSAGTGTGILLFLPAPGGVRIEFNEVYGNDDGIALLATQNALVRRNQARDSVTLDGIFVDDQSSNNRIEDNDLQGNAQYDCHDASFGGGTATTDNDWRGNRAGTESLDALCSLT